MKAAPPPERMGTPAFDPTRVEASGSGLPARTALGWLKLALALGAILIVPLIPQVRAAIPVDRTILLLVPAMAACTLVGWWLGGRLMPAVLWMAAAIYVTATSGAQAGPFENLTRGWGLLLAGSFGMVCLLGERRSFFSRALSAVVTAFVFALVIGLLGSVTATQTSEAIENELARRNSETMATLDQVIAKYPNEWTDLTAKSTVAVQMPAQIQETLDDLSSVGTSVFPALLALESIAVLALAWATYQRLARPPLGEPLARLRDFRFNDQLIWGLIVGLVLLLLPTLAAWHGLGRNLVVFFGGIYAVRGLGVLVWFTTAGGLVMAVTLGVTMFWLPILGEAAVLGFVALAVPAIAIGLSDTWGDWRARAAAARSGKG